MKFIPVIGMHRSGTSCLAGICEQAGIFYLAPSKSNPFNKKGNRENFDLVQINEKILHDNNLSWDLQRPEFEIKLDGHHHSLIEDFIMKNVRIANTKKFIGFKDPRITLMLNQWKEFMVNPLVCKDDTTKVHNNFFPIATYRHPIAVVSSLQKRDKMLAENALNIWMSYNVQVLDICKQYNCPLIYYSHDSALYSAEVIMALSKLNRDADINVEILSGLEFFSTRLNANDSSSLDDIKLPLKVRKLLQDLHEYRWKWLGEQK